jgi:hypothetical protein
MHYPPLSFNVIQNDIRCHCFSREKPFLLPGDEKCDNKKGRYLREF